MRFMMGGLGVKKPYIRACYQLVCQIRRGVHRRCPESRLWITRSGWGKLRQRRAPQGSAAGGSTGIPSPRQRERPSSPPIPRRPRARPFAGSRSCRFQVVAHVCCSSFLATLPRCVPRGAHPAAIQHLDPAPRPRERRNRLSAAGPEPFRAAVGQGPLSGPHFGTRRASRRAAGPDPARHYRKPPRGQSARRHGAVAGAPGEGGIRRSPLRHDDAAGVAAPPRANEPQSGLYFRVVRRREGKPTRPRRRTAGRRASDVLQPAVRLRRRRTRQDAPDPGARQPHPAARLGGEDPLHPRRDVRVRRRARLPAQGIRRFQALLPLARSPAHRRHPVLQRQESHAGGVLLSLQYADRGAQAGGDHLRHVSEGDLRHRRARSSPASAGGSLSRSSRPSSRCGWRSCSRRRQRPVSRSTSRSLSSSRSTFAPTCASSRAR